MVTTLSILDESVQKQTVVSLLSYTGPVLSSEFIKEENALNIPVSSFLVRGHARR